MTIVRAQEETPVRDVAWAEAADAPTVVDARPVAAGAVRAGRRRSCRRDSGERLELLEVQADVRLVRGAITVVGTRRGAAARSARQICERELALASRSIGAASGHRRGARRDARIESAWHAVHRARALLPLIVPADAFCAQSMYAVQRVGRMRPRDAALLARLTQLARKADPSEENRHTLSYALSAAYAASDREFRQVRHLRDRLGQVAWLTAAAMVLVVLAGTFVPTLFPLCVDAPRAMCPSGRPGPTAGDTASVAVLGMIGAGITAVAAVRRTSPSVSPYRLTTRLGLLRIPFGAVVAVVGVMVLQARIVTGFDGLDTQQEIAVYALVFGFAQEVVTRLLENRAMALQRGASGTGVADGALVEEVQDPPGATSRA